MTDRAWIAITLFVVSQAAIWGACWAALQWCDRREAKAIRRILERGGDD